MTNAMQHFFEYKCETDCGISKVRLEGREKDWIQLRKATENLNQYGFEWWTESILEIIDKIIKTYNGTHTAEEN